MPYRVSLFRTLVLVAALHGAIVVAPGPASAQTAADGGTATADEAEVEFRLGNESYIAGDFRTALSHYFSSYRLVPNRNVLFNVAKCYENLDQFVEAHRYYTSYLTSVEAADERKKVTESLQRIEGRIGVLVVESTPPGATVYLNRKDLGAYGTTPARVPVKPGTYDVILEKSGFVPRVQKGVELAPGETAKQSFELPQRIGEVALQGTPSEVRVRLLPDGELKSLTLPASIQAPLGNQRIEVSADGFQPQVLTVAVTENRRVDETIALEAETGTLVVESSEPSSAIYLDGELVGFAPAVITAVVGEHELVVRSEGFEPFRQAVQIDMNARVAINAAMTGKSEVAAASRVAEAVRDAPASVSLIGSREIEAFGYTGTRDALIGTRGMFFTDDLTFIQPGVRGYGPFGQFGNRMLVLVDGHTFNDSWLEASFHEFELLSDLYGLERIELVRGPTSVLYGSGAFQGVINLESPDIDDEFQSSRVGASAVGNGVFRGYAHVRETFEGGGVQASVGTVRGQPREFYSPAREASGEDPTARGVGDFWTHTARLNAKFHDFTLYSMFQERDKQSPTGEYETIYGDVRTREQDTRAFVGLRYEPVFSDVFRLESRVYGDYYAFDGRFPYDPDDGGLFSDTFNSFWGGVDATALLSPFDGARWSAGFEVVRYFVHSAYSFDEEEPLVDEDTPFTKLSGSVVLRQDFSEQFAIWGGVRYDQWLFDSLPTPEGGNESSSLGALSPRLVFLTRPVDTATIKLIGARGFRAPSVYELTYNDGGQTQIANPGLTPETTWNGELEYTQELPGRFESVVATYVQQIDNRIEVLGDATDTDPLQFQNVDSTLWATGAEFELRRPFFRGWMAAAQYTYQRARDGGFAELFDNDARVPNSPEHLASVKLVAPVIARSLLLSNRVVYEASRLDRNGDRTLPVVLWDVMFSGTASNLPIRWSAGLRNALDWRYVHPVGDEVLDATLRQAGRTFVADLAVTF